jgi:hypothetical protein
MSLVGKGVQILRLQWAIIVGIRNISIDGVLGRPEGRSWDASATRFTDGYRMFLLYVGNTQILGTVRRYRTGKCLCIITQYQVSRYLITFR